MAASKTATPNAIEVADLVKFESGRTALVQLFCALIPTACRTNIWELCHPDDGSPHWGGIESVFIASEHDFDLKVRFFQDGEPCEARIAEMFASEALHSALRNLALEFFGDHAKFSLDFNTIKFR